MLEFQPEQAEKGNSVFVNAIVLGIMEQRELRELALMTDVPAGRAAVLTM
jgi:hypothetical protein